ncbi:hypothetical protein D3C81_1086710 [compost metagenome]
MLTADRTARHRRTQQWCQLETRRRLRAAFGLTDHRLPALQQGGVINTDAGEGQSRRISNIVQLPITTKDEIAARMMFRVVDHHQMRLANRQGGELGEIEITPDVAIDRDEWRIAQQ